MFRLTGNRGFHVKFANGYTVSVQFGGGNYCENHGLSVTGDCAVTKGSEDAECGVLGRDGELFRMPGWDDIVNGWMSAEQVLELMNTVATLTE